VLIEFWLVILDIPLVTASCGTKVFDNCNIRFSRSSRLWREASASAGADVDGRAERPEGRGSRGPRLEGDPQSPNKGIRITRQNTRPLVFHDDKPIVRRLHTRSLTARPVDAGSGTGLCAGI
jgi:hypothetical protein